MGDINNVRPMEKQQVTKLEEMEDDDTEMDMGVASNPNIGSDQRDKQSDPALATSAQEIDNVIQDEIVDINRFRYQNQFSNVIYSTCPIIPKYHTTFGEPIDRQEVSSEFEQTKDADPKKG